MSKANIEIVTVTQYGRVVNYYWRLSQLIGDTWHWTHTGSEVSTEEEAYEDLAKYIVRLHSYIKKQDEN